MHHHLSLQHTPTHLGMQQPHLQLGPSLSLLLVPASVPFPLLGPPIGLPHLVEHQARPPLAHLLPQLPLMKPLSLRMQACFSAILQRTSIGWGGTLSRYVLWLTCCLARYSADAIALFTTRATLRGLQKCASAMHGLFTVLHSLYVHHAGNLCDQKLPQQCTVCSAFCILFVFIMPGICVT